MIVETVVVVVAQVLLTLTVIGLALVVAYVMSALS